MFISKVNKIVIQIASEMKYDINDFLAWNNRKNPDMVIPAGYVYLGRIKKY